MLHTHRSQSALEYMMTYGWAILIIVIVAAVLYSLGIFSPSSSISATITGFAGLGSVSAQCFPGGGLVLSLSDSLGVPIQVTKINTTNQNGKPVSANFSTTVSPGSSSYFVVADSCSNTTGLSYSNKVSVTYIEPGQTLPGPYVSSGTVTGKVTSQSLVADFNGINSFINYTKLPTTLTGNVSFSLWAYIPSFSDHGAFFKNGNVNSYGYAIGIGGNGSGGNFDVPGAQFIGLFESVRWIPSGYNITSIGWHNFVLVINGSGVPFFYMDGVFLDSSSGPDARAPTPPFAIGTDYNYNSRYFNGKIEDVQAYNYSLSPSEVYRIYSEGLGGSPISNTGLIGWWPLDGNPNDYSGNNNNGLAVNIQWVSP
ncbi:LamG domain-containing protein [Candidatus Parvarchaeota archaeon]|nr:LamG domain-containing protein [Candidatus Parvarchaeota archaeon]